MALFRTKNHVEDDETETVTIPDFVEDKTTSKSVDMSIFKMSDEELYDDVETKEDEEDGEEEYDDEPKKGGKGGLIFCIILILILVACVGGAGFYALKEHKAYVESETKLQQVLANENAYKQQIAEKDNLIASLNQQLEEMKEVKNNTTPYIVVDGGMFFRTKPEADADKTTFNGKEKAMDDDVLNVIEVVDDKDDNDTKWAKLADNVYVCIEFEGEVWAKKQ